MRFRGEYFYMSNMYECEEWVETDRGILVPTTEHAYQANKMLIAADHETVAGARARPPQIGVEDERTFSEKLDGVAAKNLAHQLIDAGAPVVPGWNEVKVGVMYDLNLMKYRRNPHLARLLIDTGDMELIEGNDWGDNFWGEDPEGSGNGENHLGKVLMRVRAVLCSTTN